jgi:hypothetical protein
LKAFEENLEAGMALLSQTLELNTNNDGGNSRAMAHTAFLNYYQHQKNNSNETHETIESQNQQIKNSTLGSNGGGT